MSENLPPESEEYEFVPLSGPSSVKKVRPYCDEKENQSSNVED